MVLWPELMETICMPVEALGERLWLVPLLTVILDEVATYQLGTRT